MSKWQKHHGFPFSLLLFLVWLPLTHERLWVYIEGVSLSCIPNGYSWDTHSAQGWVPTATNMLLRGLTLTSWSCSPGYSLRSMGARALESHSIAYNSGMCSPGGHALVSSSTSYFEGRAKQAPLESGQDVEALLTGTKNHVGNVTSPILTISLCLSAHLSPHPKQLGHTANGKPSSVTFGW